MRKLSLFLSLWLLSPVAALAAAPPWPTLKQQLEEDRVVPGSALERLIAENQDFRLLRPEEAHDQIRGARSGCASSGARRTRTEYSRRRSDRRLSAVLKEIHEWMLTHQDLLPGLAGAGRRRRSQATDRPSAPTCGSPARQTSPRSESDIRINYWNPQQDHRRLEQHRRQRPAGAVLLDRRRRAPGGRRPCRSSTGDAFHSDPTVDWTSDGTAWSTTHRHQLRRRRSCGCAPTSRPTAAPPGRSTAPSRARQTAPTSRWSGSTTAPTSPYQGQHLRHLAQRPAGLHEPPHAARRRLGHADPGQRRRDHRHRRSAATSRPTAAGDVFGFWPDTGNRRIYWSQVDQRRRVATRTPVIDRHAPSTRYDIGVPAFNSRRRR